MDMASILGSISGTIPKYKRDPHVHSKGSHNKAHIDSSSSKPQTLNPRPTWQFPEIIGTFLEVPIIRNIVYWGLYWGPLILGNYHMGIERIVGSYDVPCLHRQGPAFAEVHLP